MRNPFDDLDAEFPAPAPAPAPAARPGKPANPFDALDATPAPTDLPAAGLPGDGAAAVGRGIVNGVPVVGPYLLGGLNRVAAGVRSLKNDTKFSDELKRVEAFGEEPPRRTRGRPRAARCWAAWSGPRPW